MKRSPIFISIVLLTLTFGRPLYGQAEGPLDESTNTGQVGSSGGQSMNPDISFIVDGATGFAQYKANSLAGDDPDIGGTPTTPASGFTLQEAELAGSASVDPYAKGDVFFTIGGDGKFEVEEAYLVTTSLPADLQIKAGVFRSSIGRQNGQHLHVQDFTRRPLINQYFLGIDGLRAPGLQLSVLLPLPFYSLLAIEGFSTSPADDSDTPVQTFGGGGSNQVTGVATLKNFFPLGEEVSMYWGFNFATGQSSTVAAAGETTPPAGNNIPTDLLGTDLYVKYKPSNYASGFFSLTWQTEYFFRMFGQSPLVTGESTVNQTQTDGGLYTQVVMQIARRWFLGGRIDLLGLPQSQYVQSDQRYSGDITFVPSEFSKWRLYAENEVTPNNVLNPSSPFDSNFAVYLQYEICLGAHGAHAF